MEAVKKTYKSFLEFYETDDVTDSIIKRDYYNSTAFIGAYPIMKKNYRIWSMLLLTVNLSNGAFQLLIMGRGAFRIARLNFTLFTFVVQIFFIIQLCMLMVITVHRKRKQFRTLHREMIGEFFYYEEDESDVLEGFKKENLKEKKMLLFLPVFVSITGSACIIFGPIIDQSYGSLGFNVTETTINMNLPLPADCPFDTSNPTTVNVIIAFQGLVAVFVVSTIGSLCIVFINLMQYFNMHQKYLIAMLNRLEVRAEVLCRNGHRQILEKEKVVYRKKKCHTCLENCLKRCYLHHQLILGWSDNLNDMYSIPVGICYATGTLVIALSLFSIKTGTSLPGTAITSTMMCILEVGFMGLMSVYGQRMTDLNDELRMTMYNIKWYSSQKPVKSSMLIFQEMSLRPMFLVGFGLMHANFDTFASVMNSAYSYYNLINAF